MLASLCYVHVLMDCYLCFLQYISELEKNVSRLHKQVDDYGPKIKERQEQNASLRQSTEAIRRRLTASYVSVHLPTIIFHLCFIYVSFMFHLCFTFFFFFFFF
jgi:hypothetical protein